MILELRIEDTSEGIMIRCGCGHLIPLNNNKHPNLTLEHLNPVLKHLKKHINDLNVLFEKDKYKIIACAEVIDETTGKIVFRGKSEEDGRLWIENHGKICENCIRSGEDPRDWPCRGCKYNDHSDIYEGKKSFFKSRR